MSSAWGVLSLGTQVEKLHRQLNIGSGAKE